MVNDFKIQIAGNGDKIQNRRNMKFFAPKQREIVTVCLFSLKVPLNT